MDSSTEKLGGSKRSVPGLQFSRSEVHSSCSSKVLQTPKVEHLWDSSFALDLGGGGHIEKQETETENRNGNATS